MAYMVTYLQVQSLSVPLLSMLSTFGLTHLFNPPLKFFFLKMKSDCITDVKVYEYSATLVRYFSRNISTNRNKGPLQIPSRTFGVIS